MITGFENITTELSPEELNMVPIMIKGMSRHVGEKNAISSRQIISSLLTKKGIKITDARIRKLVNYIRNNGLIMGLVASSRGYFISQDLKQLQKYVESLTQRENEIRKIRQTFQQYLHDLNNSPSLIP